MRENSDDAWFFPKRPSEEERSGESRIYRLALKSGVEICLEKIFESTDDRDILTAVANANTALCALYEASEAVIARHEAQGEWDFFRLLHRQLVGYALEFVSLASRMPEQPCNPFKAQQLNRVLKPLKERMEADMGVTLSLAAEDGSHSYSDVSVLLRSYQDVSAAYVRRHYNGNPPVIPSVPENWAARLVQDQILLFCMDEPKGILEIADMLGYKDKKTVRKYLNPLLDEGLLARTVPDKPNSRNQRYITARNC